MIWVGVLIVGCAADPAVEPEAPVPAKAAPAVAPEPVAKPEPPPPSIHESRSMIAMDKALKNTQKKEMKIFLNYLNQF